MRFGNVDIDGFISISETFYIQLYGKVAEKATSLNQVREILYGLPKYIPITRFPPTSRAFYFHMLRVYLQISTWVNLKQILQPEKYGFARNDTGSIIPIVTDKSIAPEYLLREMKCSCHKQNRAGLLCTGCSCSKSGLSCTLLCKCNAECSNN